MIDVKLHFTNHFFIWLILLGKSRQCSTEYVNKEGNWAILKIKKIDRHIWTSIELQTSVLVKIRTPVKYQHVFDSDCSAAVHLRRHIVGEDPHDDGNPTGPGHSSSLLRCHFQQHWWSTGKEICELSCFQPPKKLY